MKEIADFLEKAIADIQDLNKELEEGHEQFTINNMSDIIAERVLGGEHQEDVEKEIMAKIRAMVDSTIIGQHGADDYRTEREEP